MHNAEVYPVSFFSQTFELAHKILTDLHQLEADQLEFLSRQMEEHKQQLYTLPTPEPTALPEREEEPEQQMETVPAIAGEERPLHTEEPITETPVSITDKKTTAFLNDLLEKRNLSDFRKAFSLNDRFRFRRELFDADEERMNKVIADLDNIQSYEDSMNYLHQELSWDMEDEAVADFIKLLEKRFS